MAIATNTALQAKTISTSFTVNDLEQSMRFYEGLGFGVGEKWEENGAVVGVMMHAGDVEIGLNQDDWKKGRDRIKGLGMGVYIGTEQDIDQLAARARDAGITLQADPHDTPWGTRAFQVRDPDGFVLTISSDT
jgi:uncharacterized glyoxalase superfamily protein PhnB